MKITKNKPPDKLERGNSLRTEDYDDWDSRFMLRADQDEFGDKWGQKGWFKPSCIPISIILILIVLVVLLPLLDAADKQNKQTYNLLAHKLCQQNCRFTLVESIPEGLVYENWTDPNPSTFEIWKKMLNEATQTIEIGSYYWTLRNDDVINESIVYPGSQEGEEIFNHILEAGLKRGIKVRIAQNLPSQSQPNLDTDVLVRKNAAEVRSVNMPKLVGGGILHTKMWVVDRKVAYIGSANLDWRSLTQVKELGVFIENCTCLVNDIAKLFDIYWMMGAPDARLPDHWPESLDTEFNKINPMTVLQHNIPAKLYITSSPPPLCTKGRTTDVNGIVDTINKAERFVYVSVMDYLPLMIYTAKPEFWPIIDDALRAVAINHRVEVRLLISHWNNTKPAQPILLKSIQDISSAYKNVRILVKLFEVPSSEEQKKIPFARVNHNKYMVTDKTAYIGTSNWSGDYFVNTGGVGFILSGNTTLRQQLEDVFHRDWNSQYAYDLPN